MYDKMSAIGSVKIGSPMEYELGILRRGLDEADLVDEQGVVYAHVVEAMARLILDLNGELHD